MLSSVQMTMQLCFGPALVIHSKQRTFKTSVPEGKARGGRGKSEKEPCFFMFFMAENYLGLNPLHLLSPLVQSLGEKNEGPDRRSKYFALYSAVSNLITNYEENTFKPVGK